MSSIQLKQGLLKECFDSFQAGDVIYHTTRNGNFNNLKRSSHQAITPVMDGVLRGIRYHLTTT